MGTFENVASILQQSADQGKELPSMRKIRAMLGNKGSMSTISAAVKKFQYGQLREEGVMPEGFDEASLKRIGSVIWESVEPVMQKTIQNARNMAQKKVDIEKADATRVRQAAEEMLAEAERIMSDNEEFKQQYNDLKIAFAHVNGALEESRRTLVEVNKEVERLKSQLRKLKRVKDKHRLLKRRHVAYTKVKRVDKQDSGDK